MFPSVALLAVTGMLAVSGVAVAAPSDDDDDHIADALAASSLRMLEHGFWVVGPGTRDTAFVSGCLGGLDTPGRLAPVPGEGARGVSNVYLYQPDSVGAPGLGELITVAIVTVDDEHVSTLDWFVLLLGDDRTAECRRDELFRTLATDPDAAGFDVTVDAEASAALGVGDASSRLDVRVLYSRAGSQHPVSYTLLVARTGRTIVVVRFARFGAGPASGVDPHDELVAMLEDLADGR